MFYRDIVSAYVSRDEMNQQSDYLLWAALDVNLATNNRVMTASQTRIGQPARATSLRTQISNALRRQPNLGIRAAVAAWHRVEQALNSIGRTRPRLVPGIGNAGRI